MGLRTMIWVNDMNLGRALHSDIFLSGKKGRVGKIMRLFPSPKEKKRSK